MKKAPTIFIILLILIAGLSPLLAQNTADILKKMIDAQGGEKLLSSIKDSTMSGTMEMIQMGLTGSLTMYQKEPNLMRMEAEVMGMTITQAFDGEKAWMINPQTGAAEELPPEAADDIRRQALGNDALLHPEKYGISYNYKGKEQINGKDYFVLEQAFSDGFKATLYIDPDTYLVYKTKARTTNQMGIEVEAETIMSEYKKIEGMPVPQKLTILQDGEEFMTMTITEVKFNTGLEDSFFKIPDQP